MVGQIARDLRALRGDIAERRDEGATITSDRLHEWTQIIDYAVARLEEPLCPQCREPMEWDADLRAHVCHHEDGGGALPGEPDEPY